MKLRTKRYQTDRNNESASKPRLTKQLTKHLIKRIKMIREFRLEEANKGTEEFGDGNGPNHGKEEKSEKKKGILRDIQE